MTEPSQGDRPVEIGRIGAPHGVRGALRVFLHNPDTALFDTLPVELALHPPEDTSSGAERSVRVRALRPGPRFHTMEIEGVASREAAASLTHWRLFVPRALLGESDEEEGWLGVDLEGLRVLDPEGVERGTIAALADFGAGPILVVRTRSGEVMVPFAEPWVGEVRPEQGCIVIDIEAWITL